MARGILQTASIGIFTWLTGPGIALAQPVQRGGGYGGYWGPHMMFGGWGGGWLGWIMMILFWVLIVAGVVALVKWLVTSSRSSEVGRPSGGSSALDILKERYARGEITKDEFQQMRKDLQSD